MLSVSTPRSSERDNSGKEKVEKNSELDWLWFSRARDELEDGTLTGAGGGGMKSRIQDKKFRCRMTNLPRQFSNVVESGS